MGICCIICKKERSLKNFKRHLKSHDYDTQNKTILNEYHNCVFCQKICKNTNSLRNHERLCVKNPNRIYISHTIGLKAWNKGLSKTTDIRIENSSKKLKEYYLTNKPTGCCSEEYLGSEAHKKASAKGGGYRENAGRSKKFKVLDSFGKETTLQSSFELRCSEILNELQIKWIRPKALKYDGRNYFADFYLIDFNLYLDPKNEYKAKLDKEKIEKVKKQNNTKVEILLEHQLTLNYISSLVQ